MASLRNAILFGACFNGTIRGNGAFPMPPSPPMAATPTARSSSGVGIPRGGGRMRTTALHRNSPGFVGFSGDDSPDRSAGYGGNRINSRRPMDDPFAPPPRRMSVPDRGPSRGMSWEDPPNVGMNGRVVSRESNLSRRDSRSVNEDPRGFEYESRYSRPPHPSSMAPPHVQQQTRGYDGRIQGGSRHTYQNAAGGRTFVETDGRPLDIEVEVWEGPNNTPTKVKMYSEDGRSRPMNILTNNYNAYGRGGMTSVRNAGPMEFPVRAGVSGGGYGAEMGGYGAPIAAMGEMTMSPSGVRPPMGDMDGRSPRPSTARGETVQGGALRTFTLPANVNAAQVTITSDGLPVNAKVELWGTSSHIKQVAEVYNDNGQTRPFAAIIDVPGGENTIAVRNTGPLEYPIRVVVEPVGMGGGGYGYGYMDELMDGGYGGFGRGRMLGGPPPPPMGDLYLPPLPPPPF